LNRRLKKIRKKAGDPGQAFKNSMKATQRYQKRTTVELFNGVDLMEQRRQKRKAKMDINAKKWKKEIKQR
jgi:hypothetical protein